MAVAGSYLARPPHPPRRGAPVARSGIVAGMVGAWSFDAPGDEQVVDLVGGRGPRPLTIGSGAWHQDLRVGGWGYASGDRENVRTVNDVCLGESFTLAVVMQIGQQTSTFRALFQLQADDAEMALELRTHGSSDECSVRYNRAGEGFARTLRGTANGGDGNALPQNDLIVWAFSYSPASARTWLNGLYLGGGPGGEGGLEFGNYVGMRLANGAINDPRFLAIYEWDRPLDDAEVRQLSADPFALLRPAPTPAWMQAPLIPPLPGYRIYGRHTPDGDDELLASTSAINTSVTIPGLAAGWERWVYVRAVSKCDVEDDAPPTGRLTRVRLDEAGELIGPAPAPVIDLVLTQTEGGGVTASWGWRRRPNLPEPDRYDIYVAEGSAAFGGVADHQVDHASRRQFSKELGTFAHGTRVRVAVAAVADDVAGPRREVSIVADAQAPAAPQIASVEVVNE